MLVIRVLSNLPHASAGSAIHILRLQQRKPLQLLPSSRAAALTPNAPYGDLRAAAAAVFTAAAAAAVHRRREVLFFVLFTGDTIFGEPEDFQNEKL